MMRLIITHRELRRQDADAPELEASLGTEQSGLSRYGPPSGLKPKGWAARYC
jgi:hypothetical protein